MKRGELNSIQLNENRSKWRKTFFSSTFFILVLIIFIVLFTYSSLNLKNIDYGYKMQELSVKKRKLVEEIDRLKSIKANLLNLSRVERIVKKKLGYKYPRSDQFIKVFED